MGKADWGGKLKVGDPIYVRDARLASADPDWKEISKFEIIKVGRVWITFGIPNQAWTHKNIRKSDGEFQNYYDNNHLCAFASLEQVEDQKWYLQNKRRIVDYVSVIKDVAVLRRIAAIMDEPVEENIPSHPTLGDLFHDSLDESF